MDSHAIEYYSPYTDESPSGHFRRVIALHDNSELRWSKVREIAPKLSRGWYELSHLSIQDRIEFVEGFWLTKLPYHPCLSESLDKFFSYVDDVGIFLTQKHDGEAFDAQMVYSLVENSGFFHGSSPASDQELLDLQRNFPDYILPADYMAFLQIHNGFSKLTDTGIMKSSEMKEQYYMFQNLLDSQDSIVTANNTVVNPKSLIPFYKSFGMPFFQCFWGEWYPENEMGNVYYSGITRSISDCTKSDFNVETMAFETFTDWLMFYLEKIG